MKILKFNKLKVQPKEIVILKMKKKISNKRET